MASLFDDDEDDLSLDEQVAEIEAAEPVDFTPKSNPDLLGHEAVERGLLADFNAGRLPHALILAGPSGIGKATLAYRLAKFLLSVPTGQPQTLHVSPSMPVFRRIVSGGHADLLTVEREYDEKKDRLKNDISVESVRRIAPFLRKTAAEGGWRVVIVDGAEHLNASGQNALLKILEEPPAGVILILTTSRPGGLLPTVRSRCRLVQMDPLDTKTVESLLEKRAPGLSPRESAALSQLAEGSIGRALQYHLNDGVTLYASLLKVVETLPDLDLVLAHDMADKIGRSGAEASYDTARSIMTDWCARLARAEARDGGVSDILPGDAQIFHKLFALRPPRHFFRTWEKMSQLFSQTESYNLDKRQAILSAFLMLQKPDYQGLNLS
jgi:DNA polymerase-3 subunit delta'